MDRDLHIRGDGLCLRRTAEGDLDFVLAAERHEDNRPFVGQWTREQHGIAIAHPHMAHLIVENAADRRPIGYIILDGLFEAATSLEFKRIVVVDKGKGFGRKTIRLVKRLAFEELGVHRLWLDVRDHNARARHVYESEGFVFEGLLRECIRVDGCYQSLLVMSILEQEYAQGSAV